MSNYVALVIFYEIPEDQNRSLEDLFFHLHNSTYNIIRFEANEAMIRINSDYNADEIEEFLSGDVALVTIEEVE